MEEGRHLYAGLFHFFEKMVLNDTQHFIYTVYNLPKVDHYNN